MFYLILFVFFVFFEYNKFIWEFWVKVIVRGVIFFRFWCFIDMNDLWYVNYVFLWKVNIIDIYFYMNNYVNWLNVYVYLFWNLFNICISVKDWLLKVINKFKLWYRIIFFSIMYLFELFFGWLLICCYMFGKWGWMIYIWWVIL